MTAIHQYLVGSDGQIKCRVTFFGKDDEAAEYALCNEDVYAGLDGDTIDIYEDISELPDASALRNIHEPDEDDEEDPEDEEDEEDEEDDEEELEARIHG